MSSSYDPDWAAKVTVPAKHVGERWEFFYGGDVPVKEGTLGELTLSAAKITDERFRLCVTQELTVKILDEETPLLLALSDRSTNGSLVDPWPKPYPSKVPVGTTRFAQIRQAPLKKKISEDETLDPTLTRGGLFLKLAGLERCELHGGTVLMPEGLSQPTATSLNHAFTWLSQAHEKQSTASRTPETCTPASSSKIATSAGTHSMICAWACRPLASAICCTGFGRKSSRSLDGGRQLWPIVRVGGNSRSKGASA